MRVVLLFSLLASLHSNCNGMLSKKGLPVFRAPKKSTITNLGKSKKKNNPTPCPQLLEWLINNNFPATNRFFDLNKSEHIIFGDLGDFTENYAVFLTPLGLALSQRNREVVQLLLDAGINPNDPVDLDDRSALVHLVCRLNHWDNKDLPELIELLVKYNADVNAIIEDETTLLHYLAACSDLPDAKEIIKVFVESGANCNALNCLGMTPDVVMSVKCARHSLPIDEELLTLLKPKKSGPQMDE